MDEWVVKFILFECFSLKKKANEHAVRASDVHFEDFRGWRSAPLKGCGGGGGGGGGRERKQQQERTKKTQPEKNTRRRSRR